MDDIVDVTLSCEELAEAELEQEDIEEDENAGENEKDENGDGSSDPYAYTKRDEFTSENFKIEVTGLPKFYPVNQLKKLMNNILQLKAHKVKPTGPNKSWAYINFRDEPSRQRAIAVLTGYKWKGNTLQAKEALPVKDPLIQQIEEKMPAPYKVASQEDDDLTLDEKVQKAVTTYAHMPYDEQIETKEKHALGILRKFGSELSKLNPDLRDFVTFHKLRRKGQVCEVDPMVKSPVIDGYRNKCEFTVGINPDTQKIAVGCRLASYRDGSVSVAPVTTLKHISDEMKKVAELFEKFCQESGVDAFDPVSHDGVWRQLTVRTTRNKDLLIVIVIYPQEHTEEQLKEMKTNIVNYFTDGDGQEAGVTSIFFQVQGQRESGVKEEFEHLWGLEYMTETIMEKKFRVSVDAFLQVNTDASELLYKTIEEYSELDPTSVLLDICCGTGTIGITQAENCFKVMGVEMVEQAVEDARHNAKENDLDNIVFFQGKAEEVMSSVIERSEALNTVAVVDPPRAGLNNSVISTLRKCEYIKRIVYISCDPANAVQNFLSLGRPKSKNYKGEFFVPVKAVPIDLFPHTPHYELVVAFERYDESKWRRIMDGNPRPRDQEYFNRIPPQTVTAWETQRKKKSQSEDYYYEEEAAYKRSRLRGGYDMVYDY